MDEIIELDVNVLDKIIKHMSLKNPVDIMFTGGMENRLLDVDERDMQDQRWYGITPTESDITGAKINFMHSFNECVFNGFILSYSLGESTLQRLVRFIYSKYDKYPELYVGILTPYPTKGAFQLKFKKLKMIEKGSIRVGVKQAIKLTYVPPNKNQHTSLLHLLFKNEIINELKMDSLTIYEEKFEEIY